MPRARRTSRRTATSDFGASSRESHDSSAFYGRFRPPELSSDDTVLPPTPVAEPFVAGDARAMHTIADGSVALVVTSPPYFVGKQYEVELEHDGVPSEYLEFLDMLHDVFAECVRVLEPGGRIAVNVANLGRKPYRSLASDVIGILQDDLGLLLRGELVWQKGEGASGSCAWGSFRSAANPVLRDVTERVIVASKGRFDRARSVAERAAAGLPHESTIATDDFTALTLDVWSMPPESAKRVGHPAPFPIELPEQLIRLYTYAGDLVLDPFMGSGTTLVAASRLGRRYVGYDLDPGYVEMARERVAQEGDPIEFTTGSVDAEGESAVALAERALAAAGFTVTGHKKRIAGTAATVAFTATDAAGREWAFDVPGGNSAFRGGLQNTSAVFRALGRAAAVAGKLGAPPVWLTTHLPKPKTESEQAVHAAGPGVVFDVIDVAHPEDVERLAGYASAPERPTQPARGWW